jgi:hypothetical protein
MANLSAAQSRALEIIKRDYCFEPFSKPYDEVAKRDVSSATLGKLSKLVYIEVVNVNESSYYTREKFGRGNYYQHKKIEVVYRFKND